MPCAPKAIRNCGGDIELEKGLREAVDRGRGVPGGACGFWGACGAAVGAGIFASIVTGSSPLDKKAWALPNMLTARCLERMAEIGGPRCCKRSSYIAIETAAAFSAETLGIAIPVGSFTCKHQRLNKECIGSACPYFGRSGKDAGI